jgi:hypothetical protein
MTQYLPKDNDFLKEFIYNGYVLDIQIDFQEDNTVIPIKAYVQKNILNDFTYFYLIIQIDIPGTDKVQVSLNHPTNPKGISTLHNMSLIAQTYLPKLIPTLIHKNKLEILKHQGELT